MDIKQETNKNEIDSFLENFNYSIWDAVEKATNEVMANER